MGDAATGALEDPVMPPAGEGGKELVWSMLVFAVAYKLSSMPLAKNQELKPHLVFLVSHKLSFITYLPTTKRTFDLSSSLLHSLVVFCTSLATPRIF